MCGRFASALKPSDAWLGLMQEWSDELFGRYNVSPAAQIGAFVEGQCHAMRWGLVPSWSKEISTKYATFNARIEGIESKPAFRGAWHKQQRCLIPALGYYEWRAEEGTKQPYFVTAENDQPLVFAGLWDSCDFNGVPLKSCAIITTESKQQLKDLHKRMPVMLNVESAEEWLALDGDTDTQLDDKLLVNKLLADNLPDLKVYKVDKRVNNSRQDDAELIQPV